MDIAIQNIEPINDTIAVDDELEPYAHRTNQVTNKNGDLIIHSAVRMNSR